ncbi:hypothetical protein NM688_g553 [Phlebia brevispora]|uniref:Uncharacterized protein n=1 Tax=Phlebia brevispora TaxID=194682 RepID=A0ACC1TDQ3_9APHY|nr:hypothetical protein NM688_g553 [Phlebia brevispora]
MSVTKSLYAYLLDFNTSRVSSLTAIKVKYDDGRDCYTFDDLNDSFRRSSRLRLEEVHVLDHNDKPLTFLVLYPSTLRLDGDESIHGWALVMRTSQADGKHPINIRSSDRFLSAYAVPCYQRLLSHAKNAGSTWWSIVLFVYYNSSSLVTIPRVRPLPAFILCIMLNFKTGDLRLCTPSKLLGISRPSSALMEVYSGYFVDFDDPWRNTFLGISAVFDHAADRYLFEYVTDCFTGSPTLHLDKLEICREEHRATFLILYTSTLRVEDNNVHGQAIVLRTAPGDSIHLKSVKTADRACCMDIVETVGRLTFLVFFNDLLQYDCDPDGKITYSGRAIAVRASKQSPHRPIDVGRDAYAVAAAAKIIAAKAHPDVPDIDQLNSSARQAAIFQVEDDCDPWRGHNIKVTIRYDPATFQAELVDSHKWFRGDKNIRSIVLSPDRTLSVPTDNCGRHTGDAFLTFISESLSYYVDNSLDLHFTGIAIAARIGSKNKSLFVDLRSRDREIIRPLVRAVAPHRDFHTVNKDYTETLLARQGDNVAAKANYFAPYVLNAVVSTPRRQTFQSANLPPELQSISSPLPYRGKPNTSPKALSFGPDGHLSLTSPPIPMVTTPTTASSEGSLGLQRVQAWLYDMQANGSREPARPTPLSCPTPSLIPDDSTQTGDATVLTEKGTISDWRPMPASEETSTSLSSNYSLAYPSAETVCPVDPYPPNVTPKASCAQSIAGAANTSYNVYEPDSFDNLPVDTSAIFTDTVRSEMLAGTPPRAQQTELTARPTATSASLAAPCYWNVPHPNNSTTDIGLLSVPGQDMYVLRSNYYPEAPPLRTDALPTTFPNCIAPSDTLHLPDLTLQDVWYPSFFPLKHAPVLICTRPRTNPALSHLPLQPFAWMRQQPVNTRIQEFDYSIPQHAALLHSYADPIDLVRDKYHEAMQRCMYAGIKAAQPHQAYSPHEDERHTEATDYFSLPFTHYRPLNSNFQRHIEQQNLKF